MRKYENTSKYDNNFIRMLYCFVFTSVTLGFPGGSEGKVPAHNAGDPGSIPGSGKSPGERRTWQPHSSIPAWRIPWMEEPGGLCI